jgi:hypothetical protein
MKKIIFTVVLIIIAFYGHAQTFGGPPSFTPDVLDNPIDGGLGILLGAGAAYGAKVLRDKRNKSNENQRKEEE